jgi:transcriptional regulator with XRE-family HTH domain
MSAFGSRLRELRKQAGLSIESLADRAGLHRMTVAKIELGQRAPAWATAVSLARALDVEITAFLDTGPSKPPPAPPRGRRKK